MLGGSIQQTFLSQVVLSQCHNWINIYPCNILHIGIDMQYAGLSIRTIGLASTGCQ